VASYDIAKYKEAKKTVERRRTYRIFIWHLVGYVLGNLVIGLWNLGTYYLRDNDTVWFYVPLLFWGAGLIVHSVLAVALFDNWWDRDERLVEQHLNQ
jgi:hypothetical protein